MMSEDDLTPEGEALLHRMVCAEVGDACGAAIVGLQRARGGLQYLEPAQFDKFVAALRALDQLYQAVKGG